MQKILNVQKYLNIIHKITDLLLYFNKFYVTKADLISIPELSTLSKEFIPFDSLSLSSYNFPNFRSVNISRRNNQDMKFETPNRT